MLLLSQTKVRLSSAGPYHLNCSPSYRTMTAYPAFYHQPINPFRATATVSTRTLKASTETWNQLVDRERTVCKHPENVQILVRFLRVVTCSFLAVSQPSLSPTLFRPLPHFSPSKERCQEFTSPPVSPSHRLRNPKRIRTSTH